ncbi:MAG: class I SAM-dependent methyltransferase [Desulfobulbaceae bacterium]|nr:class I SAM-dependent methyltransferase [Desulfobulbaceae bacterium]
MAEEKYINACPVGCDSQLVDTEMILPEGCLKLCVNCGHLVSQCSESRYLDSMVEFDDTQGTWPPPENLPRLARTTIKLFKRLKGLTGKDPHELTLLDVGCSSGAFINTARKLGVNVEGVEPAKAAAEAAKKVGLNVHNAFLQDAGLSSEGYDVITLFEVIEHVRDIRPLIEECCRLLKKKGVLVIRTGNSASWSVKILKGAWEYFSIDKHGGHISFYNQKSVSLLAEHSGFKIAKFLTHSVSLVDKEKASYLHYRFLKILAELMNLPAKLSGNGQEMEVVLIKKN